MVIVRGAGAGLMKLFEVAGLLELDGLQVVPSTPAADSN
jgi:hypothetical protein